MYFLRKTKLNVFCIFFLQTEQSRRDLLRREEFFFEKALILAIEVNNPSSLCASLLLHYFSNSANKSKAKLAHKGILCQRQRPTQEALQATVLRKSISTLSIASDGEFPVSKFVKSIYINLKIENLKRIPCNVIKIFLQFFFEKGRLLCHTIEGRS